MIGGKGTRRGKEKPGGEERRGEKERGARIGKEGGSG